MGIISTQTTSAVSVLYPRSSLSVHCDIFSFHLTELLGVGGYVTSVASCGPWDKASLWLHLLRRLGTET